LETGNQYTLTQIVPSEAVVLPVFDHVPMLGWASVFLCLSRPEVLFLPELSDLDAAVDPSPRKRDVFADLGIPTWLAVPEVMNFRNGFCIQEVERLVRYGEIGSSFVLSFLVQGHS